MYTNLINGIYQIKNLVNQKVYIGSASGKKGFIPRWNEHKRELSNNIHHSPKLQNAWNKYGAETFKFEIVLLCDPEDCLFYEQIYLDYYKPEYNIAINAKSPMLGRKWSELSKSKLSKSRRGEKKKPFTEAHKENISKARLGKCFMTEEHKQKIKNANIGNKHRLGIQHTKEAREKISRGNRKLSDLDIEQIKKLILDKVSVVKIAKQFSIHRNTVYRVKNN